MSDKTHKLAATVITDIVGYTKYMEEDEQKTMQLLQKQREIISPLVETHKSKIMRDRRWFFNHVQKCHASSSFYH